MPTVRQQALQLLQNEAMSVRELSQALGVSEKDLYAHLAHVARSLQPTGRRLVVEPFDCLACGYRFKERRRFTAPGRCPRCRRTHIEAPRFRVR